MSSQLSNIAMNDKNVLKLVQSPTYYSLNKTYEKNPLFNSIPNYRNENYCSFNKVKKNNTIFYYNFQKKHTESFSLKGKNMFPEREELKNQNSYLKENVKFLLNQIKKYKKNDIDTDRDKIEYDLKIQEIKKEFNKKVNSYLKEINKYEIEIRLLKNSYNKLYKENQELKKFMKLNMQINANELSERLEKEIAKDLSKSKSLYLCGEIKNKSSNGRKSFNQLCFNTINTDKYPENLDNFYRNNCKENNVYKTKKNIIKYIKNKINLNKTELFGNSGKESDKRQNSIKYSCSNQIRMNRSSIPDNKISLCLDFSNIQRSEQFLYKPKNTDGSNSSQFINSYNNYSQYINKEPQFITNKSINCNNHFSLLKKKKNNKTTSDIKHKINSKKVKSKISLDYITKINSNLNSNKMNKNIKKKILPKSFKSFKGKNSQMNS